MGTAGITCRREAPTPRAAGHAPAQARRARVWWLNPAVALVLVVAPTLVFALWASPERYAEAWRTPKWVSLDTVYLVLPAALSLLGGMVLGAASVRRGRVGNEPWPAVAPQTETVLRRAFGLLVGVTFGAYALWGSAILARGTSPASLVELLLAGDLYDGDVREGLRGLSGVTTLTQVGIAAVTVGALLDVRSPSRRVRRSLVVLFVLAALRSYLLSERLALVELLVPYVVVRAAAVAGGDRPRRARALVVAAPVLAVPLLFAVFAGFELSRSWSYFAPSAQTSYGSFAADRLLGYYATSYNNAQTLYDHHRWPDKLPYYTLEFFWSSPPVEVLLPYEDLTGAERSGAGRDEVLGRYNNIEFNSPNGLVSPAYDFGLVGGAAFLAAAGVGAGALYQSFDRGRLTGLLLYPVVFTGLLDLPRQLYWALGRTLPVYVSLLLVLAAVGRSARRRAAVLAPVSMAGNAHA